MPKPYHIIATEDGNGYNVTIPENPNVSTHCRGQRFESAMLHQIGSRQSALTFFLA